MEERDRRVRGDGARKTRKRWGHEPQGASISTWLERAQKRIGPQSLQKGQDPAATLRSAQEIVLGLRPSRTRRLQMRVVSAFDPVRTCYSSRRKRTHHQRTEV